MSETSTATARNPPRIIGRIDPDLAQRYGIAVPAKAAAQPQPSVASQQPQPTPDELAKINEIRDYLITLHSHNFTGSVTINFYLGTITRDITETRNRHRRLTASATAASAEE